MLNNLEFTPLVWLILLAFATFRVGWFLAREEGPFALAFKMREVFNEHAHKAEPGGLAWTVAELFNCPICVGVWTSLVLLIAVIFPVFILKLIILFLAISGLQTFLVLLIIKDE